jgi:succinate dehydrogenase / fumarate reductase cytochrome b subunit
MNLFSRIWNSSLGKKYIMAATGCALFLFVVGHLLGNLQIFLGWEAINRYGSFLQSTGELLWVVRIGLLIMVVLHIISAVRLTTENRAARGQGYVAYRPVGSSYASRTMMMSGLIVAAFIIYHLLHFTVQTSEINFTGKNFHTLIDAKGRHDVFAMMVHGFSQPVVSLFYIVAMALLSLHLSHGVSSMFQSMGWKKGYYKPLLDKGARFIAIAIFVGYVSIPIAVLLGFGRDYVRGNPSPGPLEMNAPAANDRGMR